MSVDVCVDMCAGVCADTRADVYIDMCVDMWIDGTLLPSSASRKPGPTRAIPIYIGHNYIGHNYTCADQNYIGRKPKAGSHTCGAWWWAWRPGMLMHMHRC